MKRPAWLPRWWTVALAAMALGTAGVVVLLLSDNCHVVIEGEAYRSAQPTPARLRDYQERLGIQSVVNLRGTWPDDDWYQAEHQAARTMGLSVYDVALRTHRLAPVAELKGLVRIFDECRKPVLIHCARGADRTSLASAIYLVLRGQTPAQALAEYRVRYGHNGWARGHHLPHLFDLYQAWLDRERKTHSPDQFRQWVGQLRAIGYFGGRVELVESPGRIQAGEPIPLRLRATNQSDEDWSVGRNGIHLYLRVVSRTGGSEPAGETAPLQYEFGAEPAAAPVGQSIEFRIELPPLSAGSYEVLADLVDAYGFLFHEMAHGKGVGPCQFVLRVESPEESG